MSPHFLSAFSRSWPKQNDGGQKEKRGKSSPHSILNKPGRWSASLIRSLWVNSLGDKISNLHVRLLMSRIYLSLVRTCSLVSLTCDLHTDKRVISLIWTILNNASVLFHQLLLVLHFLISNIIPKASHGAAVTQVLVKKYQLQNCGLNFHFLSEKVTPSLSADECLTSNANRNWEECSHLERLYPLLTIQTEPIIPQQPRTEEYLVIQKKLISPWWFLYSIFTCVLLNLQSCRWAKH